MAIIKRVGVFSLAKIHCLLFTVMGFILGIFFSLFSVMMLAVGGTEASPFGYIGLIAIVLFPIFYGVMGFIMGAIMAALFNIASRWFGGLEIELDLKGKK